MKTRIAKWGNSLAVRLPKPLAEDLGLTPGREVEIRQDGTRLTVETATGHEIPRYRLEDLLAQIEPGRKPPPFEDWSAVEVPWPDDDWSGIAPDGEAWDAMRLNAEEKRTKQKRRP